MKTVVSHTAALAAVVYIQRKLRLTTDADQCQATTRSRPRSFRPCDGYNYRRDFSVVAVPHCQSDPSCRHPTDWRSARNRNWPNRPKRATGLLQLITAPDQRWSCNRHESCRCASFSQTSFNKPSTKWSSFISRLQLRLLFSAHSHVLQIEI